MSFAASWTLRNISLKYISDRRDCNQKSRKKIGKADGKSYKRTMRS